MNGDDLWARLTAASIPGLPLLAYLTIDRPATAFPVRGALFILLLGCFVIVAAGSLSRTHSGASRMLAIIAVLEAIGLGFAYALDNWWMSALASFTGLIAFVIARSPELPGDA